MSEDIEVTALNKTLDPEKVICQAARNDYMSEWIGETDFGEVMKDTNSNKADREWAEEFLATGDMGFEKAKMEYTKRRGLIRQLLQHGHYGPFEHPQITFAVKGISRSCMAQLTRHRHASFDVQSMRYVKFDDKDPKESVCHIPELSDPGLPGRNAEFRDVCMGDIDDDEMLAVRQDIYWDAIKDAFAHYQELLDWGVAPENARMVLPIGTEVNLVFSVNARMLMHIADMRAEADAQWEIRELTEQVLDIAEKWCPATFSYYKEEMQGRKNRLAP